MTNPFVYGEVVPTASFVDREVELDRLTGDLQAGQKIFLISPRRYGKSSLVRQALPRRRAAARLPSKSPSAASARTSRSSKATPARWCRWKRGSTARPPGCATCWRHPAEVRVEPDRGRQAAADRRLPGHSHRPRRVAAGPGSVRPARTHRRPARPRMAIALDEFQAIGALQRRQRRARAARRGPDAAQVGYVFSGSEPTLMERMLGRSRPFYKAGPVMRLQKIPADRFAQFIDARFKSAAASRRRQASARRSSSSRAISPTTCSGSRTKSGTTRAPNARRTRRSRRSARHAQAAARRARDAVRKHVAAADPGAARRAARGGARGRQGTARRPTCARATA